MQFQIRTSCQFITVAKSISNVKDILKMQAGALLYVRVLCHTKGTNFLKEIQHC